MHNFVCKYRHVLIKSPIILQGCSRYGVRENEFGAGNAVLMTGFYISVSPLQSINNPMLLLVYIWFYGLTLSEKKWFVNMSTFGQVKICLCVRMPLWAGKEREILFTNCSVSFSGAPLYNLLIRYGHSSSRADSCQLHVWTQATQ